MFHIPPWRPVISALWGNGCDKCCGASRMRSRAHGLWPQLPRSPATALALSSSAALHGDRIALRFPVVSSCFRAAPRWTQRNKYRSRLTVCSCTTRQPATTLRSAVFVLQ